jgi:hypothetical protein
LPFVKALDRRQHQVEQADLYYALMVRLQALAREKLNAPLVAVYSWPDERSGSSYGGDESEQALLVSVLHRLRERGVMLVSVDDLTSYNADYRLMLPYDGHPTALVNELIAGELKQRLRPSD